MTLRDQYAKIEEFLKRGEEIKRKEFHRAEGGFLISFVKGPLFDAWMGEINIFNERYLKGHPLYRSIYSTYFHRGNKPSAFDDMMGHLRALYSDDVYFGIVQKEEEVKVMQERKTLAQLLSEDIKRCEEYFEFPINDTYGQSLYVELTSRYDGIISNLGNGLYQYFAEQHFYDPEVSGESLAHNIKSIHNKLITYQAQNYPPESTTEAGIIESKSGNRVFIVHGHDDAAIHEMARTLDKGGFDPIILREQPDDGLTIIEKIEQYSDVGYAVVLYTQCDLGRVKTDPVKQERFRARQNVVFEHGYLIGKLSRSRVCALVKGDVETPGDISGVVYVTMDEDGAWKMRLARNMRSAGLNVDMNKFCE